MRILIVNTFYYPNMIGGTENSVKILAENLVKQGNEVAILCGDAEKKDIIENIKGVKVYRYFTPKHYKLFRKIMDINNIHVKKRAREVIKDFKPDIVHTNNLYRISNNIWKIAKKEFNIPIVHTLRDYWMLYPIISMKKISKIFIQPFMKNRTKYVDIVTAPSNYTLKKFIDNGFFASAKKECVYNAINIDIEETKRIINEKRKKEDINIRFMYVGMLTNDKGIQNLIKAFKEVKDENISLHIFGQGILEGLVKQSEREDKRISYYGQLTAEKLKNEWIKNDVLIVPSIWEEPFGRVVIEGNQFGLPVIGANRAGISETISNIHTGITYQYDDIEELKKSIRYFENRENIKQYYKLIINNIKIYSIEEQIRKFDKLYIKLKND